MASKKSETDQPKCGLCGKTKRLIITKCCGNWICDDADSYVAFSYERNSCYRNHNHYTLCGYHYNEDHPGHWKDCPECRAAFETEMYVYYGTNEYNFEKLENPPAYKPTRCSICGRIIKLGDGTFTQSGNEYWCEICSRKKLPNLLAEGEEPPIEMIPARSLKIGRNDPCPCGSGKKYKRCCYGKQTEAAGALQELKQAMKGKEFGSLKEVQAFADWHTGQKNRAPIDDFAGLSPEQMHRFLNSPFSSPDLVTFPEYLAAPPKAPMARLFDLLVSAIGENGLKATSTGNLPLDFVRQSALVYFSDEERKFQPGIRTETDFFDLHVTRITSSLAGLIRKYRGRFILTARYRKLLSKGGALYPLLFRAFAEKYDWAFRDGYPDFRIIQQSFLFSLWLFSRFGTEWRSPTFYEDCFLRAFPLVLLEVESERDYTTPEETVRSCYTWRCIEGFAVFSGILEVDWEKRGFLNRSFRLRKTALLDEIVAFHLYRQTD